jgi:microcystin-dependent protein
MAVLAPISGLPRFRNGKLVADAVAYFYDAGTTTPRTVYQSASGAAHTQPVSVLGDGNFPAIYVTGDDAYKIRVEDGDGVLITEYDELQGEVTVSSGGGGGGGTTIPTGFEMMAYDTGAVSGWVRENGRTIGSASSGATERANDDVEALFTHLWNKDANLAVSGGRGASAAADWGANKTIALPDARGRVLVGLDDMGSSAAGRLTGGTFTFGAATTLGSYGGIAAQTLTTANLSAHTHGVNDPGHTHGKVDPGHVHGITDPTHSHNETALTNVGTAAAGGGAQIPGAAIVSTTASGTGISVNSATTGITVSSATTGITTASAGTGTAHNNMQPFTLRSIYIKL